MTAQILVYTPIFMNMKSFFQKPLICLLSISFLLLGKLQAQTTCHTFTYVGAGAINAATGCNATIAIPPTDISLSVTAPCTIINTPTFASAKTPTNVSYNNGAAVPVGTILNMSYTATVNDGTTNKVISLDFTVVAKETTPPVIGVIPANITLFCNPGPPPSLSTIVVTDNCDSNPTITYEQTGTGDACATGGTITRTWTATDKSGNQSKKTQIITLTTDNDAPSIVTDATDYVADCSDWQTELINWLANNGNSQGSDNCGPPTVIYQIGGASKTVTEIVNLFQTQIALDQCLPGKLKGEISVEFIYRDACGKVSVPTIGKFSAQDNTAPIIDAIANNVTIQCDTANIEKNLERWIANAAGASFIDECSDDITIRTLPTLADAKAALAASQAASCGNTGSIKVKFFGSDKCANESSETEATFTVIDTRQPRFVTLPKTKIISCSTTTSDSLTAFVTNNGGAIAVDGCGNVAWSYFWKDKNGTIGASPTAPSIRPGCNWYVDLSFVARDECNNGDTTMVRFIVKDDVAPTFNNLPADVTVACNAVPTATTVTATDACNNDATVTYKGELSTLTTACSGNYILTRTWEAIDSCQNKRTGTQQITVTDNIAPTLVGIPGDMSVSCDAIPAIATNITATDNCDNAPKITFTITSTQGTNPNQCDYYRYEIKRTWTATDICGNTTSRVQTITVNDTQKPIFVAPADATIECYQVDDFRIVGEPTNVRDNCNGEPLISYKDVAKPGDGTCSNLGIIIRTWVAYDGCDSTTIDQTILMQDTEGPAFDNSPTYNVTIYCTDALPAFLPMAKDLCDMDFDPRTIRYREDILTIGCSGPNTILRIWEAEDKCGNIQPVEQIVTLIDNKPPVLSNCPQDVTLNTSTTSCDANVALMPPSVSDECGSNTTAFTRSNSQPITSTVVLPSTIQNTPANDINLAFGVTLLPSQTVTNISLRVALRNADAEDNAEYFDIIGEDNSVLGKTAKSAIQCGNSAVSLTNITATQIYNWAADGVIRIKLRPNVPADPSFAVNAICPNGAADGELKFIINNAPSLTYSYRINNSAAVSSPLTTVNRVLPIGTHNIKYYVRDCQGNRDSCAYKVTIQDKQKPQMTAPANQVYNITTNDCIYDAILPLPSPISENCDFGTSIVKKVLANGTDSLLTFSYDPNYQENFPNDVIFNFTNVTANTLGSNVQLKIDLKAEANNATTSYFDIYGEGNTPLGRTAVSTCTNSSSVTLTIPASQFNTWATDGNIVINAIRFRGIPLTNPPTAGAGINPCTPLNNGKDGSSWMRATLSYNTAIPTFYTTGATVTAPTPLVQVATVPKVTFRRGITRVFYTLADKVGNIDTISYTVTVNDAQNPVAKCKNAVISVNPFTTTNTMIDPMLINGNSTDNCGIQSFTVAPAAFSCADKGATRNVTLTVRDSSGRSASCIAAVYIEPVAAKPLYTLGLCTSDTLRLFANPPTPPSNVAYTYKWDGPNGFVSTDANPTIPNVTLAYAGTYKVTVTNPFAACDIEGVIIVPISSLPNTPVMGVSSTKPCTNSELTLTTQPYSGRNLRYRWYKGVPLNATLIDSTNVPSYIINNPIDTARYFVVVRVDGCTSNPSAPVAVTPVKPPVATLTTGAILEICEGGNIALGTTKTGIGVSYQWTGPNGFTSASQYPAVITDAKTYQSGAYNLIVVSNGCESTTVSTQVNVKPTPATPQIVANGRDCEGATINLATNIIGAASEFSYRWVKPDFNEEPTTTNTLTLTPLNTNQRGDWKVYVIKDGCRSETSAPIKLNINGKPIIAASYQTPVCENGALTLNGTAPLGSSFVWSGPNGAIGNGQNITTAASSGLYTLSTIAPNGCDNTASISVTTTATPAITAISSTATTCVTGAEDIKLTPTIFPFNNDLAYTYQWTGGNNISSVEKNLIIPNATAAANGTYTLIVMTGVGCQSKPYTYTIDVKNTPATPAIKGNTTQNICEGNDLLLELDQTYSGANVSFEWKTPAGDSTTTNPTFKITNVKSIQSGDYSVKVIVDGCESNISGTKKIIVNTTPLRPDISTNSPVCEGEAIKLMTPQIASATYEWVGPGFSSGISEPVIPNATKDKQGAYRVRVIQNGCSSVFSNVANIVVNTTPTAVPTVANNGPVCMDNATPSVTLSVNTNTALPGATYTWYSANGTVLGAASAQLNYNLNLGAFAQKDSTYEYYVVAAVNGCVAKASIPTSVMTNKVPNQQAFAGADELVCDATSITLKASKPVIGSGLWAQTEGSSITIVNPTLANTAVSGLVPGQSYTLQWKLSNGACRDYAFDELKIKVSDTSVKAEAGDSINICAKNTTALKANNLPTGVTGLWTQTISQEQLGVKITDPINPKSTITGLTPGNRYIFKWTLSNAACKDYSTDDVYVTVAAPEGNAQAEADKKICGNAASINATPVQGVVGTWLPMGNVQIVSPNSASTSVKNLQAGSNKIVWTLSNAICGTYSRDTLVITTEVAAIAVADNINVPYAGAQDINVTANDIIPTNGYTISIINAPKQGTATISADRSKIQYKANSGFAGADVIEYQLCNAACPTACTSANVNITILGGTDCTIATIITPNGDLTNDRWEIPCLAGTQFTNNTVVVFNQWGDEVFRSASYKNDWEGTYNGNPLPNGTYFFVVDFGNGDKKSGFLIIER